LEEIQSVEVAGRFLDQESGAHRDVVHWPKLADSVGFDAAEDASGICEDALDARNLERLRTRTGRRGRFCSYRALP
jgi:hypothetical protein